MVHQCVSEDLWFRTMLGIEISASPLPAYGMMDALGGIAFGLLASRYPRLRLCVPHLGRRMVPTIVVFSLLMVVVVLVLRLSGFDLRAPRSSPPDLPKPNAILLVADSFRQDVLE